MFPLPVTNLASGALMVYSTQVTGWRAATVDAAAALGLLAVALALGGGPWRSAAIGAGVLWLGCIVSGHTSGALRSIRLAVQLLVLLASAAVLLAWAFAGDPQAFWQPVLEELVKTTGATEGSGVPRELLDSLASMMHGVVAASLLSSSLLALLAGSWLAAPLSGAPVQKLFLNIQLGRLLGALSIGAAAIGLLVSPLVGGSLLLVLGTGFAAQGLSVVHWTAHRRRWHAAWPFALYLPMLISPPLAGLMLLLAALIGFADNWINLRRPAGDVL